MTIGDRRASTVRLAEPPRDINVTLDANLDEVRAFLLSRLAGQQ
jgi:hypothetical protein